MMQAISRIRVVQPWAAQALSAERPEFQKIIDCRSAVGRAAPHNARPADGTISNRLIDLRPRSCQL